MEWDVVLELLTSLFLVGMVVEPLPLVESLGVGRSLLRGGEGRVWDGCCWLVAGAICCEVL